MRCLFLLVFLNPFLYIAQTKDEIAFQKLKAFDLAHSASEVEAQFPLFYNKLNYTIETGGWIIPIQEVTAEYNGVSSGQHSIVLQCSSYGDFQSHCIRIKNSSGEYIDHRFSIRFPFKTKEDCYTFINLLADLKFAINQK